MEMIRRLLLAFLLVLVVGSAWADPTVTLYGYTANPKPNANGSNCSGTTTYVQDVNAAGAGDVAFWQCALQAQQSSYNVTVTLTSLSGNTVSMHEVVASKTSGATITTQNINDTLPTQQGCADGSTPTGNPATCPKACSDMNAYNRKFYYTNGGPYIAPTHYGVCNIAPVQMLDCRIDAAGTYCYWQFKNTGSLFTGVDVPGNGGNGTNAVESTSDPVTKSPAMSNTEVAPNGVPCPTGTVQAGVDSSGIPVCMGTGTDPVTPTTPTTTTNPTVTKTNADGSTTAVSTQSQQNSDGSTTTTTTTTTTSTTGAVTVSKQSQTSSTPSGAPGTADNPAADQNNLCKQNPNLTICQNSTVSGTCGSISCTGDAIQCATLRAAAAMQCKQQADSDALAADSQTALGQAVISGADPQAGILPTPAGAEVVQMQAIDNSGWLGGGSYFKDKTVVLPNGSTLVLPLSQGADLMIGLRYVTMIVSALVCFKIVRGTFSSSGV